MLAEYNSDPASEAGWQWSIFKTFKPCDMQQEYNCTNAVIFTVVNFVCSSSLLPIVTDHYEILTLHDTSTCIYT